MTKVGEGGLDGQCRLAKGLQKEGKPRRIKREFILMCGAYRVKEVMQDNCRDGQAF
jgi:hypothetical protein